MRRKLDVGNHVIDRDVVRFTGRKLKQAVVDVGTDDEIAIVGDVLRNADRRRTRDGSSRRNHPGEGHIGDERIAPEKLIRREQNLFGNCAVKVTGAVVGQRPIERHFATGDGRQHGVDTRHDQIRERRNRQGQRRVAGVVRFGRFRLPAERVGLDDQEIVSRGRFQRLGQRDHLSAGVAVAGGTRSGEISDRRAIQRNGGHQRVIRVQHVVG